MRLECAHEQLTDPQQRIEDIATRMGYQDAAFFCRQFRNRVGISPGAYRFSLMQHPER